MNWVKAEFIKDGGFCIKKLLNELLIYLSIIEKKNDFSKYERGYPFKLDWNLLQRWNRQYQKIKKNKMNIIKKRRLRR